MDLQLQNKIALVTGSTAGIGESIAKTLAHEGARVVIHGRKADAAKRVTAEILEGGGQAKSVLGDLADDDRKLAFVMDFSARNVRQNNGVLGAD